ncbi:MAG: flavin reductase family protein [Promethearchaeota archaeon]|nr:MAG: flavin reductase family protein [Candidatus Lokiarchaeota archaeon]
MKNKIKAGAYLFPTPVVLIGANVKGKPNFETLAYVGIVEATPPMISISSYETHYTNIGIKENGTFSVNTPSEGMIEITDYCGLYSGKEVDKSGIFEIFYGELKTAPMITHSPLNLECKVVKTIDIKEISGEEESHEIFIGQIIHAYADEYYLTEEKPDILKLNPLLYSSNKYWKLSESIGEAFNIGEDYIKK